MRGVSLGLLTWLVASICLLGVDVDAAWAHRVRIFAWTEGQEIVAEAGFGKGKPAKHCSVYLEEGETGAGLDDGFTNDKGLVRFPLPEKAVRDRLDLRLVIVAGEGHRGEWVLEPADYLPADELYEETTAGPVCSGREVSMAVTSPLPYAVAGDVSQGGGDCVDAQELRAVVEKAVGKSLDSHLEAKLGPLRHMMAKSLDPTPGINEIVGGIGWLVGLAGMGAYFKSRGKG
jgi:nickel transport protein